MNPLPHLVVAALAFSFAVSSMAQSERSDRQRQGRKGKARQAMEASDPLKVGDTAPDFNLKTADGKRAVRLSSFQGKRPVVLVFGSYT
jgi:hypothetical protein